MKCLTQREPKPQERGTRSWYTLPAIFGLLLAPAPYLLAQVVVEPIPGSLSNHTVIQADGTKTAPLPAGLNKFLKKNADGSLKIKEAVKLGKALFYDQQLGSDGMACASCHFHSGADSRIKNTLNPKADGLFDDFFNGTGPNLTMTKHDFPFAITGGHNGNGVDDPMGSGGVHKREVLDSNTPLSLSTAKAHMVEDGCANVQDLIWHVNYINVRRETGRNTPTTYNAVFALDNFWDGRAKWMYNGVDPLGRRTGAMIEVYQGGGVVQKALEEIDASMLHPGSLFSQADGPPRDDIEMSCSNRAWQQIGKKMNNTRPLKLQTIHPNDSVLKDSIHASGKGLTGHYQGMIKQVFQRKYWRDETSDTNGFTQMDRNFSLFFGIAVGLWESTLVSDNTPFDIWNEAGRPSEGVPGFGEREMAGLSVFQNEGKCINCHLTSVFFGATTINPEIQVNPNNGEVQGVVERMMMGDGEPALYDLGFYNIGVRPTEEDLGRGRNDLPGSPLSFSEQFVLKLLGQNVDDRFQVDPCKFAVPFTVADFPVAAANNNLITFNCPGDPAEGIVPFETVLPGIPTGPNEQALIDEIQGLRLAVKGAFKTAGLRNVWLTGPYFHNGGKRTLEEVIEFYDDGGDFGLQTNPEKDPDIVNLGLTDQQKGDLLRFLKALTDQRLRNESAPYDHPELWIPHGHPGDNLLVYAQEDGMRATDNFEQVPAVGAGGRELLKEFGSLGLYPVHHFMPRYGDVHTSEHEDIIDYHDVAYVTQAVGTSPNLVNDLRDLDNNGVIDGVDVAAVQAACDNPNCAGPKVNKVIQFMLWDADTEQPIGPVNYGDTLDLAGKRVNLEAIVAFQEMDTQSVKLSLSGATHANRTESGWPYMLGGDSHPTNGDIFNIPLNPGVHTLTAVPYTSNGGGGSAGQAVSVAFTVKGDANEVPNRVTKLVLWNADSNSVIGDLTTLVDRNALCGGCSVNIEAVVASSENATESVKFTITGATSHSRTESGAPYMAGGDTGGDIFPLSLNPGVQTVTATPYTGNGGAGTAGSAFAMEFNLLN